VITQKQLQARYTGPAAVVNGESCCKTMRLWKAQCQAPRQTETHASSFGLNRCKVRPKITQDRLEILCLRIGEPNVLS
jgi:hypothetical protein